MLCHTCRSWLRLGGGGCELLLFLNQNRDQRRDLSFLPDCSTFSRSGCVTLRCSIVRISPLNSSCNFLCSIGLLNLCFVVDINECRSIFLCGQAQCRNTLGGYYCSCRAGYVLRPDGRSCKGNLRLQMKNMSTSERSCNSHL